MAGLNAPGRPVHRRGRPGIGFPLQAGAVPRDAGAGFSSPRE